MPNLLRQFRKHRWQWLFALLIACTLLSSSTVIADKKPQAEQVKAALVFKLTPFITWPEDKSFEQATFDICMLGPDDIGSALRQLEDKQADNKPVRLLRFSQSDAVSQSCRIVFIGESRQPFLGEINRNLAQHHALTISDISGFARQGGMIELTTGKRIGFLINLQAAKQAKLQLAAPLLQLSTVVEP